MYKCVCMYVCVYACVHTYTTHIYDYRLRASWGAALRERATGGDEQGHPTERAASEVAAAVSGQVRSGRLISGFTKISLQSNGRICIISLRGRDPISQGGICCVFASPGARLWFWRFYLFISVSVSCNFFHLL